MGESERRAHEDERRARQDLEALIETSPVGVVVFDGGGRLASYNREARASSRAMREPGSPVEDLLGVVVLRRADGREASLAELPLAEQFAAPTPTWCTSPWAGCGASSATAPTPRPGSSTGAASATACRDPARADGGARRGRPPRGQSA